MLWLPPSFTRTDTRFPYTTLVRSMVRHLVDAGHRIIAFIAGPGDNFDATERLRGYRDELAASLPDARPWILPGDFDEARSEEHPSELQALMRISYAVFCLKKTKTNRHIPHVITAVRTPQQSN